MRAVLLGVVLALLGLVQEAAGEEKYFPPGVWGKPLPGSNETQAEQDAFMEKFYAGRLRAEEERPLWVHRAKAHAVLSIRMSRYYGAMFPDFSMVRVAVMPDGSMTYYARAYRLCAVGETSDLVGWPKEYCAKRYEKSGEVDTDPASEIMALVGKIAPLTGKVPSQVNDLGMDGTETIFEFSGDGKFNAIKRSELDSKSGGDLWRMQRVLDEVEEQVWH